MSKVGEMERAVVQRRTIATLMAVNSLGYAGFVGLVAVVALLASNMLPNDAAAGIPAAAGTLGTAVAAAPLAHLSKRKGRRRGLVIGYLFGFIGAVIAFAAGQLGLFWLLVLAMPAVGVANASNLQNRFAAADLADEDKRARSIALVVWVGTIGAVVGSPAALWVNRVGVRSGASDWASPMLLGVAGFLIAAGVVWVFLRPDPLEFAGGTDPNAERQNPFSSAAASLRVVWPNRGARLAVLVMAVSQMAMVAVMVVTPLHMKDHGHDELSTLVIAVHVLGMFGLSPLVGRWADRVGRIRAAQSGALVLGAGTVLSVVAGYAPLLMFIGLFLLGLGWSVGLISGSALLVESVSEEDRLGAQGFADVMMSLLGAAAAVSSGFVKEAVGFHWLANFATVAAVLIFVAAVRAKRTSMASSMA